MGTRQFTKFLVALNGGVPAILLLYDATQNRLGANPVNFAIRSTGILSLIFLVLSLVVTPLSRLSGISWIGQVRRVLGLYAFFHALAHFCIFFYFDRSANISDTFNEITMRPYLWVGILGLGVMLPLAVTSTNRMIQRVGPKRWKLLHRLAYVAAIAGALHFFLLVKADTTRPVVFFALFGVLFAYRLGAHYFSLRADAGKYRTAGSMPTATPTRPRTWTGTLRLAKVFQETPEVRTFRFVLPSGAKLPFDYLPGQYLNITLMIDGRKVRRSYTIASSPTSSGYLEISVKREAAGLASRHLHDALHEGDMVDVLAPAGKFTFTGQEAEAILFIAGGVGITPLMSKIRYLTDTAWSGEMHLLCSVKTEQDIIFRGELDRLQARFPNLHVTVTLTRDANAAWTGERGRISKDLLAKVMPTAAKTRIHMCGPTELTDPMIELLVSMGVNPEAIKIESFASPSRGKGAEDASMVAVADPVAVGQGTLEFARSGAMVADTTGKTILELAEDRGIDIPYDCRSGICGQCKTKLLSGNVVMDSDDALTAADRANGIILSCQARCQDDVVVDA